jgi:molybdopterin molybdotransferase
MLTVADAQARLLDGVEPLTPVALPLVASLGHTLAADVVAACTQPPFAASAMDGYAIRWVDRAGPWRIIGTSAAGHGFAGALGAGDAARIFTGAPLPAGADTVVVQEDVSANGATLVLTGSGPPRAAAHVRSAGLDFRQGDVIVAAGLRITPARIGLIAAGGHATVHVHRRPRVALLATGDELVPPGSLPGPGQIVSSNGAMIAALLAGIADVTDGGIVPDTREALAAAIAAHTGADVLITIGGASVGDHDLVKPVLESVGATIDFWKVAMRPGKPMLTGALGTQRIIGLPGNPVSAFVCAALFAVPLLRRLRGASDALPHERTGLLTASLPANGSRRDYMRATAINTPSGWRVTPASMQDSSMLRTLADANALLIREIDAPAAGIDGPVSFLLLDSAGDVA